MLKYLNNTFLIPSVFHQNPHGKLKVYGFCLKASVCLSYNQITVLVHIYLLSLSFFLSSEGRFTWCRLVLIEWKDRRYSVRFPDLLCLPEAHRSHSVLLKRWQDGSPIGTIHRNFFWSFHRLCFFSSNCSPMFFSEKRLFSCHKFKITTTKLIFICI